VLKKSVQSQDSEAKPSAYLIWDRLVFYEVAGTGDMVGRLRNRTNRLMF